MKLNPSSVIAATTALTPQQQAAIDTKHVSIVLSAGAGCGKTSVLTRRFLSHLAPGLHCTELSRLVAITFTERAAREMRTRIREQCLERLRGCPEDEAEHWLRIVRSLDAARISTIHSFCSSLLRAHAVEAELDPKFGLLDETLGASFLDRSVESGLHRLLVDGDADAAELVFEFGLSRAKELLGGLVLQRYRIDFASWENKTPQELAREWDHRWHKIVVPQMLRDLAQSATARKVLELLDAHVPDHPVMQQRRLALLAEIPRLARSGDTGDPEAVLESLQENARVQGGGTKKNWESDDVFDEVRDVLTAFRKQVEKLREQLEYDPEHLLRGAEIGIRALRAAKAVGAHFDAAKRDDAVVDFDDLLLLARNLLRDHDEVRQRVSAGISLLMVDEFQDTDPIQDEIVQMLGGPQALSGRLFVVGDAKQSIYRFRRAEPRVFHDLRERIDPAGRLPLSRNFRSQPEILRFVNALFDGALSGGYEPLDAASPQLAKDHCVEFLFASAQDDEPDEEGAGDDSAAARRRREADWIARRLKQLLTDGVPRIRERDKSTGDDRLRTVRPRDIVILFRAMSDVRQYEERLRQQGLDYYVVGGRAFFAQQEVFDVVNLCRFLDNVDDEVALVGVLRSPFFSLSDDAIFALGRAPAQALTGAPPAHLSEPQQVLIRFAGEVLAELRDKKDRLSIAELLNLAIERTGYDAALLTEFLGARKLANLRKLVDLARQCDQAGDLTLAEFIDRLRDAVAEERQEPLAATHPESANIIRLMSIHQSKGLEFPVVVVADVDRKSRDSVAGGHFDKDLGPVIGLPEKFGVNRDYPAVRMLRHSEREQELAEARRLFYVATTRAADLLILSANLAHAGQAANAWLQLVSERFDLLTGQARHSPTEGGESIFAKYQREWPKILVHHEPPKAVPSDKSVSAGITVALSQFREILECAEPDTLPESLRTIPPGAATGRLSVSAIEDIDRELRQVAPPEIPDDRRSEPEEIVRDAEFADPAPVELGTLVHLALERVDFRNPGDVAALLDRCVPLTGKPVDDAMRRTAASCVENFLGSPLAGELSAARVVHQEIDFLLHEPSVAGTIDCLYESADGKWIVLDYKTGKVDRSTTEAELLAEYEIQLGLYAVAVQQFTGRLPDRLELAFIREGTRRIVLKPDDAFVTGIVKRVTKALHANG
ncbi:MAG: UvrD-helicase domain-containing protein [Planctomycetia bacterium]|nr:UvrD-helicase domain-containing protein [Planctomycetia bacterium]